MRIIPLTKGLEAIVDDEDFPRLIAHKWYAQGRRHGQPYAATNSSRRAGKKRTTLMHRFILQAPAGVTVDHIDGDAMNNRRSNLRLCSIGENVRNRRPIKHSSKFKGVCWIKRTLKWRASITLNGKRTQLGEFADEVQAAKAYDAAAVRLHGQFAKHNGLVEDNRASDSR